MSNREVTTNVPHGGDHDHDRDGDRDRARARDRDRDLDRDRDRDGDLSADSREGVRGHFSESRMREKTRRNGTKTARRALARRVHCSAARGTAACARRRVT